MVYRVILTSFSRLDVIHYISFSALLKHWHALLAPFQPIVFTQDCFRQVLQLK